MCKCCFPDTIVEIRNKYKDTTCNLLLWELITVLLGLDGIKDHNGRIRDVAKGGKGTEGRSTSPILDPIPQRKVIAGSLHPFFINNGKSKQSPQNLIK